jgi:outer membrane protein assembly factor BamB
VVYVGSYDDHLYAFDGSGTTGCSGTPTVCDPLWTGDAGADVTTSPSVANGLVYLTSSDGKVQAFETSTAGCSGDPMVCTPTWTQTLSTWLNTSPTIANGTIYVGASDKDLYALTP